MANIREIKTRMNSIEDTLKITNAMYLISSSKLKKARKQLDATTPYFEMLQASLLDIMAHTPDLQHIFLNKRKKEHPKKGYLVMTADRGLAGAYNHNITKMAEDPKLWGPYGLVGAYNYENGIWISKRDYALDKGLELLMCNAYLTKDVMNAYMHHPIIQKGMEVLQWRKI